jgi:hypothetical protein
MCKCNEGYTGPYCLAQDHIDESESAHDIRMSGSPFAAIEVLYLTPFMMLIISVMAPAMIAILIVTVAMRKQQKKAPVMHRATFNNGKTPLMQGRNSDRIVTGRSI